MGAWKVFHSEKFLVWTAHCELVIQLFCLVSILVFLPVPFRVGWCSFRYKSLAQYTKFVRLANVPLWGDCSIGFCPKHIHWVICNMIFYRNGETMTHFVPSPLFLSVEAKCNANLNHHQQQQKKYEKKNSNDIVQTHSVMTFSALKLCSLFLLQFKWMPL